MLNKKKYPNSAPEILSRKDSGNKPQALKMQPSGAKKMVTNREISIVSISERIVTMSAEKNIK